MRCSLPIKVFDFFAGCGGTSKGFQDAGMDIVFALDNDPHAARTFRENFAGTQLLVEPEFSEGSSGIHFLVQDIEEVPTESLQPLVDTCTNHPLLFTGCAPCQPFTKQNTRRRSDDGRANLLSEFLRFVVRYEPEFVFVENVPGLQRLSGEQRVFGRFLATLKELGYEYRYEIVVSQNYGVPQRRRRLVLLASLLGSIAFPAKTHGRGTRHPAYENVREWIGDLPSIEAGETHPDIPNHRAAGLAAVNLERIRATPEGGDRRDWPKHLQLRCHLNGYKGHTDVYGRMRWDRLATGLTTRCISLSNGRFGHPEQDRAISVREAACLQTFPLDFVFHGSLSSMARQIGNAVPVRLAKCFGENFIDNVNACLEGIGNG